MRDLTEPERREKTHQLQGIKVPIMETYSAASAQTTRAENSEETGGTLEDHVGVSKASVTLIYVPALVRSRQFFRHVRNSLMNFHMYLIFQPPNTSVPFDL